MPLYVTPTGRWSGSQSQAATDTREEGSKPGSYKTVEVAFPITRQGVIDLLNAHAGRGEPEPSPRPQRTMPDPALTSPDDARWRVGCRGQFVGSTRAGSAVQACQNIATELYAYPVPDHAPGG